jgi:hypothetical protein
MVIPGSQDEVAVLSDNPQDIRKFARVEAITVIYRYIRLDPDFGNPTAALDMNMRALRWRALIGEEVIPETALAKDHRHRFGSEV